MRLYNPRAKAALIYELRTELEKHDSNLQRALDGKSADYVPTTSQRENIMDEQTRIASILQGLNLLSSQWHLSIPARKPLSNQKKRDNLLTQALAVTAVAIIRSGQDYAPQYQYDITDLQALNDLFRYLNSKIYRVAKLPETVADPISYTSLSSVIGYPEQH